jgi:cell division protein FtsB
MLGAILTILALIVVLGVWIERNSNRIKKTEKELEDLKKELERLKASKE